MSKPAWSWKDYERVKRAEERKALKRRSDSAGRDAPERAAAPEQDTGKFLAPDSTRGHEGRVAERGTAKRVPERVKAVPGARCRPSKTRQACVLPETADPTPRRHASSVPPVRVDYNPRDPRLAAPPPLPDAGVVLVRSLVPGKIDISAAPSGMEAHAARWRGKGLDPIQAREARDVAEGYALCRCGSRDNTKARGPVPAWFGDKCIEANCELRAARRQHETRGESRG